VVVRNDRWWLIAFAVQHAIALDFTAYAGRHRYYFLFSMICFLPGSLLSLLLFIGAGGPKLGPLATSHMEIASWVWIEWMMTANFTVYCGVALLFRTFSRWRHERVETRRMGQPSEVLGRPDPLAPDPPASEWPL